MKNEGDEAADAGYLRTSIRAYARRLCDVLQDHIGVISQAGDPMSRTVYQAATLEQYDPQKDTYWNAKESTVEKGAGSPPITEQKLLVEWRTEGYRKPLLIVAPAGSGKSCLLESCALQMAKDLLDDAVWPGSEPLPIGVPLLISLAKMLDTPLNEYLPLAEQDLTERAPTLSSTLLTDLQGHGRLVLLIDGFDELPAAHGDLVKTLARWRGGFALTSRPGHGEWRVVPDGMRHRALEELTVGHARAYIHAYFTERRCVGRSTEHIVMMFDRAWTTHLGRLLRRPLYLKAWCDYVKEHNGERVPVSLGNLAHLMLLRALEMRKQFDALRPADLHIAVKSFIDWFGRLGLHLLGPHLAEAEFRRQSTETLVRQGLIGNEVDKIVRDGKEFVFESVARQCGLLMYSKQGDNYEIPKVPLVEYLIGKHLAEDAIGRPHCPQILIETFQSWIWRPDRHEILDYAFDALWNPLDGEESPWANAFLCWAKEVATSDSAGSIEAVNVTHDDWMHPFAIAVLRWRFLDCHPQEEVVKDDVNVFTLTFTRLIAAGLETRRFSDELIVPDPVVVPIIRKMIQQYANAFQQYAEARVDDEVEAWRWLVIATLRGVREDNAADLVAQWMELNDQTREDCPEDGAARLAWPWAVSTTAYRVPEAVAADLVPGWVNQHVRARRYEISQDPWCWAIGAAASRVPEYAAADLMAEWMEQQDRARGNVAAQSAWGWAIREVARRISEDVAANIVAQLIKQHNRARGDEMMRYAWQAAIQGAASRVREDTAADVVVQLIKQDDRVRGDNKEQLGWREAIRNAAQRIPVDTAADLVGDWMAQHDRARGDGAAQEDWLWAIEGAANRIREDASVELVKKFMQRHHLALGDERARRGWSQAILQAARRVDETAAADLVVQWMDEHNQTRGDKVWQDEWRWAVGCAAGRIREDAAAHLIAEWLEQHNRAHGDKAAQEAWRWAIQMAAGRVREDAALDIVVRLMKQHDQARGDEAAQKAWRRAIGGAARRLRGDPSFRDSELAVIRLCNALLGKEDPKLEFRNLAFEIAANNPSIAIIRIGDEAQLASGDETSHGLAFQAVLRRKQRLDEDLVVGPPLVRAAFVEKKLSALENSLSDPGVFAGVPEGIGQPVVDIEGIQSDINVLKQFTEFAARCRDFERRLANITARLDRPPTIGEGIRDEFEKLDLSASEIPAGSSLTLPSDSRQREKFIKHLRIFYEIGKLQLEPTKPTYKQIAAILTTRRRNDYPKEYPSTRSSVHRLCTETLPAFFKLVFDLKAEPELFEKFGANNSNCGLSATGMHVWTLTQDCLRSQGLPPFND